MQQGRHQLVLKLQQQLLVQQALEQLWVLALVLRQVQPGHLHFAWYVVDLGLELSQLLDQCLQEQHLQSVQNL